MRRISRIKETYAKAVFLAALVLCNVATATEFELRDGDTLIGALQTVRASSEETLLDVGNRHSLGFHDMRTANPSVDIWLPEEEAEVLLPLQFVLPAAPQRGIVLNLPEYRLYFYSADGKRVQTFPISIGRRDWETPLGQTRIIAKARNPSWYPPASIRAEHEADGDPLPAVVPPGPDNPLGKYALRLGLPGYLIHGTNKPAGVGMRVTHGCLRMFPEDIEHLFGQVDTGTAVRIVNQPIKAGWSGEQLYLEVHPLLQDSVDDESEGTDIEAVRLSPLTHLTEAIVAATGENEAEVNWDAAEAAFREARGVPVLIGNRRQSEMSAIP